MLNAKEGQTYICIKPDRPWWTEGKEYEVVLDSLGELCFVDDYGVKWIITYLNNRTCCQFKLKDEDTTMGTLNVNEGQTYVCKRDKLAWWTLDKEYKVQASSNGLLYLTDDDGDKWYLPNDNLLELVFKLKETQSKAKPVEPKYTPVEVTKVIIKAYQLYDNDSQRLAYIKGYFAK